MRKMLQWFREKYFLGFLYLLFPFISKGQLIFPLNEFAELYSDYYVFTHATIVKDAKTTITDATMVVKHGKIVSIGNKIDVPADAITIDCRGKFIYPSFIDAYSDYGLPAVASAPRFNFGAPAQL